MSDQSGRVNTLAAAQSVTGRSGGVDAGRLRFDQDGEVLERAEIALPDGGEGEARDGLQALAVPAGQVAPPGHPLIETLERAERHGRRRQCLRNRRGAPR